MRADMDKVIVERPRRGGRGARKGRLVRHADELRPFLGHGRTAQETGDRKSLNENLAPLRRYLERQVNRPWNSVYSEMRAQIDAANTVQAHVLTHVEMFIQRHVQKVAPSAGAPTGLLSHGDAFSGRFRPIRAGRLYVDPDDGIIKIARRRLRGAPLSIPASNAVADRRIGPLAIAINEGGVWYAVGLRSFTIERGPAATSDEVSVARFHIGAQLVVEWIDPLFGPVWAHDTEKLSRLATRYGDGLVGDAKRQIGRRDLKRHALPRIAAA